MIVSAGNKLDSSAPQVRRGKEREKPKKKRKTKLKSIILAERERRRAERLKNQIVAKYNFESSKTNDKVTEVVPSTATISSIESTLTSNTAETKYLSISVSTVADTTTSNSESTLTSSTAETENLSISRRSTSIPSSESKRSLGTNSSTPMKQVIDPSPSDIVQNSEVPAKLNSSSDIGFQTDVQTSKYGSTLKNEQMSSDKTDSNKESNDKSFEENTTTESKEDVNDMTEIEKAKSLIHSRKFRK